MMKCKKRTGFAFMAILLIFSLFLNSLPVSAVSDISYSADLGDFLTNWKLTIGDDVYDQDTIETTEIEYKKDVMYSLVLYFEEKNNLQLMADDTPLTFDLPLGFRVNDDFSTMLNVNLGKWGTLANNPITYDKNTNKLILKWNTSDTYHMKKFIDSTSAVINISLSGYLGENESDVFAINSKTFTLKHADIHNAYVTKDGSYDPINKKIDYTVEVISDGTTSDLTLTDTLGTALTYNGDIQFESTGSVNTANTSPVITVKTGNTFSVNIPAMNDKDRLVFSYSASVDPDKIKHSGNADFEETGNTAQIFGDSYTHDNTATYYEDHIEFSDLVKDSKGVVSEYRNGIGYYNVDWQVVTNKECIYPLAGTDITDTIDEDEQNISSYYGDGVEILCYSFNDLSEKRFVTWEELGIDPVKDKSWTYHIPDTDQIYKYVLNYRTTVNMENQTGSVVVKNTAAGKGGIDSAYEALNPIGGNLGISKTAVNLTSDSVTWEIKIHLKDQAFERSQIVLTEHQNSDKVNGMVTWKDDYLPYKWLNPNNDKYNTLYKETLDTLEITGLYDNETFVLNYGGLSSSNPIPARHDAGTARTLIADDTWHSDKWTPEKLSIEFYKDPGKTQGGLNRPSDGTNDRIITVRLKTKFPEEWAQHAKQQNVNKMDNVTWYYEHLNWADVEGVYDVAKIAPYPVGVYKRVLRNASSNSSQSTNMVRNGYIYPVYYYQVLVSGVESDKPLVIDDVFDTSVFELYKPHSDRQMSEYDYLNGGTAKSWDNWFYTKYGGISDFDWIKPELGTCLRIDEDPNHILTQEETDYGVRFTFNTIPKDKNNNYYKFYGVEYWLTAKDENALKKIEDMAASSPTGEAVFMNTAKCREETSKARVALKSKNDFTPIGKLSEQFIEYYDGTRSSTDNILNSNIKRYGLKYRVELNKDKAELNGGGDITVEDSYSSNLSIDFQTITIVTDPPDRKVSYDYSGNTGRFIIHDRTHVSIEYEATVISLKENSNVTVENTVTMLNYSKTKKDEINYTGSSGSAALNPSIIIKKYERGHMESGLNGAQFQLFKYKAGAKGNTESDWEPMYYAGQYNPDGHGSVPNPKAGQIITFTTGDMIIDGKDYGDGYCDVELRATEHGFNFEYDTTYGLREIKTPVRDGENGEKVRFNSPHNENFFCYKFTLTRNPQDVDYSRYIYRNDEILTVKNDPESIGLRLSKKTDGNCVPTDEEKNNLSYQLYYKTDGKYKPIMKTVTQNGKNVSVINPNFVGISYQTVISGNNGYSIEGIRLENGADKGEFLLAERGNNIILSSHPDWNWTGSYEWDNGKTGNFSRSEHTVYDQNGRNPEQVYGVEFVITDDDIRENDHKSLTLINKYTKETVDLRADKKWISPSGAVMGWPAGKTVKFELGTVVNGQFVKADEVPQVELDNKPDSNGEETAGTAVFRNLPKYVSGSAVQRIQYAVREVAEAGGYHAVYPANGVQYAVFGSGNYAVIKNQVESVSVTVNKEWLTSAGHNPPDGAKAVMRLYAYTGTDVSKAVRVNNVSDIELDGTADLNGETSPWTAYFSNLPKYDSSGVLLTYIVKEQSCLPAGFSAVESYAADSGTITNQPSVTRFSVTKKWQGTKNNEWPDNTEITLNLRRKTKAGITDDSFKSVYTLKKDTITSKSDIRDWAGKPVVVSWDGSSLTIDGLQKISVSGDEWLYYITESPIENYDIAYKNEKGYRLDGLTYSGGSIINVRAVRDLIVQKKVSGNFGSLEKEFDFKISLNKSESEPYNAKIMCEKTNSDGTITQNELHFDNGYAVFKLRHNESIRLKDIPSDMNYTAEETGSSDGYATTVSVNGETPQIGRSIQGKMTDETILLFENKRDGIIPTNADVAAPIILCGVTALAAYIMLVMLKIKRKKTLE